MTMNFETSQTDAVNSTSSKLISRGTFNLIMGLVLTWGFGVSYLMTQVVDPSFVAENPIIALIGYVALVFGGIFLIQKSDKPIVSFFGFNMIVVPFGIIIGAVVTLVPAESIHSAMLNTAMLVGVMMLIGSLFPKACLGMGRMLMVALVALIVSQVIALVMGLETGDLFSYLGLLVFGGLAAYDWAESQHIEPTVDNAIDCASGMFITISNIFLDMVGVED